MSQRKSGVELTDVELKKMSHSQLFRHLGEVFDLKKSDPLRQAYYDKVMEATHSAKKREMKSGVKT